MSSDYIDNYRVNTYFAGDPNILYTELINISITVEDPTKTNIIKYGSLNFLLHIKNNIRKC